MAVVARIAPKPIKPLKFVKCIVEGAETKVPVTPELYARYEELFRRDAPSELQRRRHRALKRLMVAAYKAGQDA